MTLNFSHNFIRLFHRRLKLPKPLVYNAAKVLLGSFGRKNKHNIIQPVYTESAASISKQLGYLRFNQEQVIELTEVVEDCLSLFEDKKSQFDQEFFIANPNKRFLLTLDSDENLLKLNSINKLLTSSFINNAISDYLASPYVLSTVRLWWSTKNDTATSSQMFHADEEDLSQLKLFININSIGEAHGPFTFIDAGASEDVIRNSKTGKKKFTDEQITSLIDQTTMHKLTGESGSAAFVDTSRCLHYGSRSNQYDRLVLMAQFLRLDAPLLRQSLALN